MALLSSDEIEKRTAQIPVEWALLAGTRLDREYKFADFKQALAFVNKVAEKAEEMNHHPDILLGYGKAELRITSHSEGGLTKKDFELVEAIEKIKV